MSEHTKLTHSRVAYYRSKLASIRNILTAIREESKSEDPMPGVNDLILRAAILASNQGKPLECATIIRLLAQSKTCVSLLGEFVTYFHCGESEWPADFTARFDNELARTFMNVEAGEAWTWNQPSVFDYVWSAMRGASERGNPEQKDQVEEARQGVQNLSHT